MEENNNLNKADEFNIDNGFVIDKSGDLKASPNRNNHKKDSTAKTVIWIVAIVVVSVIIAICLVFAGADYLGIGFGRTGKECVLDVKKGSGTAQIADGLCESGAVKSPILFRVYSKIKGYDGKFKYGLYTFDCEAGYESIANMLMTDGAKAESVRVTVKEGATVDDIAELLDKKGVCTKGDFIDEVQEGKFNYPFVEAIPSESVYYRLEGYLFPETYDFYSYDSKECAHLAVDKMLSTLNSKLKKANLNTENIKIGEKEYSFHEVMTMASIVELESGKYKTEAPKVAAVFYNRLIDSDFPTLGSSPTKKYPHGNGKYDTYECRGLPVGPLCSAGIDTIKASFYPAENFDYLYFVTDANMKFYYTKTLKEHNATINRLKKQKNWIYEYYD